MTTHWKAIRAITTKFHGPTNTRGSRVSATNGTERVTLHWNHGIDVPSNHTAAAEALARKLEWQGSWHIGALPGSGFCFVCVSSGRLMPGDTRAFTVPAPKGEA
jgi:hypothetical protein